VAIAASTLLHARADWVRVIESAYAPAADDEAWCRSLFDALRPAFVCPLGVGFYAFEPHLGTEVVATPLAVCEGLAAEFPGDIHTLVPPGDPALNLFFRPPSLAITHTEMTVHLSKAAADFLAEFRRRHRFGDAVGLVGHPEPGVIVTLAVAVDRPTKLTRHERRLLAQLTLHLESAYRLRKRPEQIEGILASDGTILHWQGDASDRAVFPALVQRVESSRARAGRLAPTAIDLWEALAAGRLSIVERVEGSRRHYVLLENTPSGRLHRALTKREVEVVRMAARGLPVKLIAYGLGLSSPTVSNALRNAAAKLGLASRLDLVRVASLLGEGPSRAVDPASLTRSEREVFDLVRSGASNEEIASLRSRSVRTIANQVAAVLRKTKSPTRRAVLTSKPRAGKPSA
jgi:DNA-binding CsgD family transcriptional regulator